MPISRSEKSNLNAEQVNDIPVPGSDSEEEAVEVPSSVDDYYNYAKDKEKLKRRPKLVRLNRAITRALLAITTPLAVFGLGASLGGDVLNEVQHKLNPSNETISDRDKIEKFIKLFAATQLNAGNFPGEHGIFIMDIRDNEELYNLMKAIFPNFEDAVGLLREQNSITIQNCIDYLKDTFNKKTMTQESVVEAAAKWAGKNGLNVYVYHNPDRGGELDIKIFLGSGGRQKLLTFPSKEGEYILWLEASFSLGLNKDGDLSTSHAGPNFFVTFDSFDTQ